MRLVRRSEPRMIPALFLHESNLFSITSRPSRLASDQGFRNTGNAMALTNLNILSRGGLSRGPYQLDSSPGAAKKKNSTAKRTLEAIEKKESSSGHWDAEMLVSKEGVRRKNATVGRAPPRRPRNQSRGTPFCASSSGEQLWPGPYRITPKVYAWEYFRTRPSQPFGLVENRMFTA